MGSSDPSPGPSPGELAKARASLVRDMKLALLSEIGARSIYDHLRRHVRDEELRAVLVQLNEEGAESVRRLRELVQELGGRPRRTSFRRRALARALALASRVIGVRIVLRICLNAEETVGRWYQQYALFLLRLDDPERARVCQDLARVKQTHAQTLGAWVTNLRAR